MSTATQESGKKIQAFYSSKPLEGRPAPTPVSLFVSDPGAPGKPDFDGTIGEQRVIMRIRNGAKGAFLSIQKSVKTDETGGDGKPVYKEETIGAANLVVTSKGYPSLTIRLDSDKETTIWANVSKSASEELLVRCGLNLETLKAKREAAGV